MARRRITRRATVSRDILVKVGRTGGIVSEVCLDGEHTVSAAMTAAGMEYESDDKVRVNGSKADGDTSLSNGDIVTISGKIEGGCK